MKYQGGYQIIDLSGGDIFAKAKSAFETNKPVLVYDGGIASFGNVTKDSNNFVVNYIIEDKLYKSTIAADDTVTKTDTGLTDEVGPFMLDGVNKIDLASYVAPNWYIVPADGYVVLRCTSSTSSQSGSLMFKSNKSTGKELILSVDTSNGAEEKSIFVKKGMSIALNASIEMPVMCNYYTLINVE